MGRERVASCPPLPLPMLRSDIIAGCRRGGEEVAPASTSYIILLVLELFTPPRQQMCFEKQSRHFHRFGSFLFFTAENMDLREAISNQGSLGSLFLAPKQFSFRSNQICSQVSERGALPTTSNRSVSEWPGGHQRMAFSSVLQWWEEWQLRILVLSSLAIQLFLLTRQVQSKFLFPAWFKACIRLVYIASEPVTVNALATLLNRQKKQVAVRFRSCESRAGVALGSYPSDAPRRAQHTLLQHQRQ